MSREILVFGSKTFKIQVPDDAKLTFGPFSPPSSAEVKGYNRSEGDKKGTLRVYQGTEKNIIAVFSGVDGFRDTSLGYTEQVIIEQGATVWKNDQNGYTREDKASSQKEWIEDSTPALTDGKKGKK